jgi:hypothetical protein
VRIFTRLIGIRSVAERPQGTWLRAFPKNEIDCGAGQALEFGIAFRLADSCQQSVEDVSRQCVVKDHRNPVNGNRRVSQLFAMTFQ